MWVSVVSFHVEKSETPQSNENRMSMMCLYVQRDKIESKRERETVLSGDSKHENQSYKSFCNKKYMDFFFFFCDHIQIEMPDAFFISMSYGKQCFCVT